MRIQPSWDSAIIPATWFGYRAKILTYLNVGNRLRALF